MKFLHFFVCVALIAMMGCSNSSSESSSTVNQTPLPQLPLSPSNLSVTAISPNQINLSWVDNSNNETGFKIERKAGSGGTFTQINTATTDTISYNDTGLTAATTYFYRIRSTNSIGDSAYSGEVSTTTLSNSIVTATIQLPRTGQTTCYDTVGVIITCAGTGQDGELQKGMTWPSPRFIDNSMSNASDLTVKDNLTGLIWTRNANLMLSRDPLFDADGNAQDGAVTWQHALDYITKINTESYLGHNDWRLPNINELASLTNYEQTKNGNWLNTQGFINVPTDLSINNLHWSSTNSHFNTNQSAWRATVTTGFREFAGKIATCYVWPVRGGQLAGIGYIQLPKTGQTSCYDTSGILVSCAGTGQDGDYKLGVDWPNPRFTDNSLINASDQTITDNLTGLVWSKNSKPATTTLKWHQGLDYIKQLNSQNWLGHNDWRFPNINELASLLNYEQLLTPVWLSSQGFTNVDSYGYSTSTAFGGFSAGNIATQYGIIYSNANDYSYNVWPVRGGQ